MSNNRLTTRAKFIVSGLATILATLCITGFFAFKAIESKNDRSYAEFAQMITMPMAFIPDIKNGHNIENFPEVYSKALLAKNRDISFIEYKDKNNNILYSTKNDYPGRPEETIITVSSPLYILESDDTAGMITVGMTGNSLKNEVNSQKKYIFYSFLSIGTVISLLLLINIFFMSGELNKIYKGVKEISKGQFGYKVESENMKPLFDAFNDMSEILSKYEEENMERIALERNKLEAVLMSIINGVIVCDNFDKVVLTNTAALKMLDIEEKNLVGKKIQEYTDFRGQQCFLPEIEKFKDTPLNIIENEPVEFEIEAGKLTIKSVISPMFSKQGDYVGYIIVLTDITREAEVNKLKNTFISNVSHELRTPVTVLRTYTDTLLNNGDDFDEATKKEFIQTLDTEAQRLHAMVNDILDFSRLESGNVSLKKTYYNLAELIESNIKSMKILADEKKINIIFNNENVPAVPVNPESIDRVIRNLLSNAIKYSPDEKDIIVTLKFSDDKKFAELSVQDHGMGIAKEHLEKIFDRFYRVENATHTIKGTGLGLHLVKMTVEKYHNGQITVESEEGKGSTFTVKLPFEVKESELA